VQAETELNSVTFSSELTSTLLLLFFCSCVNVICG